MHYYSGVIICLFLSSLVSVAICQVDGYDREKGVKIGIFDAVTKRYDVYASSENSFYIDGFFKHYYGRDTHFTMNGVQLNETRDIESKGLLVLAPKGIHSSNITSYLTLRNNDKTILSVWIPDSLDFPKPTKLKPLSSLKHGVRSGPVEILNAKTIHIPNFHYDGNAPDVFFWAGKGPVGPNGILVPDEAGGEENLRAYTGEDVILTLPDEHTVHGIDFLSVYCVKFHDNFGEIRIGNVRVPPAFVPPQVPRGHAEVSSSNCVHSAPAFILLSFFTRYFIA